MNLRHLLSGLLLGAALAACATPPPGEGVLGDSAYDVTEPPEWSSAPTGATPTRDAEPHDVYGAQELNERGNLPKQHGQPAAITNADGSVMVDFAVTGTREVTCESARTGYPAENGRFVAVDLVANTKNDPDQMLAATQFGYGWEFIAPDGSALRADSPAASVCSGYVSEPVPQLRPNRKYTITVVLDVPEPVGPLADGVVAWYPAGGLAGMSGWEWPLAT